MEVWSVVRVALAAVALAASIEAAQLVVKLACTGRDGRGRRRGAVIAGWYAGRVHHEGLALPFVASWLVVWFAGMTPVTQSPAGSPRLEEPRPFDWMPGLPLESGDPLFTLEEMLTKLVLFGLLGVVVAAWRLPPRRRRGPSGSLPVAVCVAVVLGLAVSAFFESGQRWYATHTPCVTDVLLGGLGAALGVLAASRANGFVGWDKALHRPTVPSSCGTGLQTGGAMPAGREGNGALRFHRSGDRCHRERRGEDGGTAHSLAPPYKATRS